MTLHFNDFRGNHPFAYIRPVMRHLNFQKPPVTVEDISAHLGIKIQEIDPPEARTDPELHAALVNSSTWIQPEKRRIRVYKRAPKNRNRIGICHENTHIVCPTHQATKLHCNTPADINRDKRIEREAFLGAAAQIFYPKLFIPDMMSFRSISLSVIDQLAERYVGSMEATAIWYAQNHPGQCAVLVAAPPEPVIRPATNGSDELNGSALIPNITESKKQSPIWFMKNGVYYLNGTPRTLQVSYSVVSENFPNRWIPAGRGIVDTSLIFKCWSTGENQIGEVVASDFGSAEPVTYFAECKNFLAGNGKPAVMVLLWLKDKQLHLDIAAYADW